MIFLVDTLRSGLHFLVNLITITLMRTYEDKFMLFARFRVVC